MPNRRNFVKAFIVGGAGVLAAPRMLAARSMVSASRLWLSPDPPADDPGPNCQRFSRESSLRFSSSDISRSSITERLGTGPGTVLMRSERPSTPVIPLQGNFQIESLSIAEETVRLDHLSGWEERLAPARSRHKLYLLKSSE